MHADVVTKFRNIEPEQVASLRTAHATLEAEAGEMKKDLQGKNAELARDKASLKKATEEKAKAEKEVAELKQKAADTSATKKLQEELAAEKNKFRNTDAMLTQHKAALARETKTAADKAKALTEEQAAHAET